MKKTQPPLLSVTNAALILVIVGMLLVFVVSSWGWKAEMVSLGVSLITAAIISIVIEKISLRMLTNEIGGIIDNGLDELRLRNQGILSVSPTTPYQELYQEIGSSKSFVLLQTWSPDMKNILEHVERLLSDGGEAEFLLLHPDSSCAALRSLDLGESADYVCDKVHSDTKQIASMFQRLNSREGSDEKDLRKRLRLKYYTSLPAFAVYKTDEKLLVAYYWHGAQSDARMNLVVSGDRKSQAQVGFVQHINYLSSHAHDVDIGSDRVPEIDPALRWTSD